MPERTPVMEKFGVEEEEQPKIATTGKTACPICGTTLRPIEETGVLLCPKCGSKPFEHVTP
jgi:DNA-directed RNA polymerase subunit RPC12/RpoP